MDLYDTIMGVNEMKNKRKEEMKQQNKKLYKKQQSGRSMVEMVGVLALMGLVTAAAFVLITSGTATQTRNRALDEVDLIASNVRGMAAQSTDTRQKFASLPSVKKFEPSDDAKNLAKALLKSDGATPFSSSSSYAVYTTDRGATFTVELTSIGADECQAVAKRAYSNGSGECGGNNLDAAAITFTK